MEPTVEYKPTVKSVEQRMLEKAAYEFASKLRSFLGKDAKAIISIQNVPLSKIAAIAEMMRDDEGLPAVITKHERGVVRRTVLYLRSDTPIKGEGFEIESIGE